MTELEVIKIERPQVLKYEDLAVFGTEKSKASISDCYEQGWLSFQDLMLSGWERDDAMRAALHTIIANLAATINIKASAVEALEGDA